MLRLTLLLCLGMFAALMTLGEDRGQLRPGLALAAAEGRLDEVWAEARARAERVVQPVAEPEPAPIVAEVAPPPAPEPVAEAAPVLASAAPAIEPVVEVQPGREVVAMVEEPVFSLSALGNEPVPGEDGAPLATAAASEVLPGTEGTIWYVNASSVNVRAAPSTEAEVLGKLGNGEAALMVAAVDDEWARIVIQGDGLEGFVALRYLSAEAP
jgi:uncharacterized protein YgiM (DUF1202 family)